MICKIQLTTLVINFLHIFSLTAKKMICALMIIISLHYGIKCLSKLLQLEPCNKMFKVIFDIIAQCYDM